MTPRKKKKQQRMIERRRYSSAVSGRLASSSAQQCRAWPIEKCLVPEPDVWRATGCGSGVIIRRQDNELYCFAAFDIQLMCGGITFAFAKFECDDPQTISEMLAAMRESSPPCTPGDPDTLARYVFGAYAWSLERANAIDAASFNDVVKLLPRVPGRPAWWLEYLMQDGFTPAGLIKALRSYDASAIDSVPDGKELLCASKTTFDIAARKQVIALLNRHEPEFAPTGFNDFQAECYDFTREYPKNHWSPLATLGGRQIIGNLSVSDSTLILESNALSMAGRLITRVKGLMGDRMNYRDTEWVTMDQLLGTQRRR